MFGNKSSLHYNANDSMESLSYYSFTSQPKQRRTVFTSDQLNDTDM